MAELDRHGVRRAALMASVPGDEASVAAAVARHPSRFAGLFMVNPTAPGAEEGVRRGFGEDGLRCACLFPAMHRFALDDERVTAVFRAAADHGRAVFVHCGVLSVGVRRKLGLASRFDVRLGDPLAVAQVASAFPDVPVIVPHFGAGFFRETLMAADLAANIHVDTSSSNGWTKYTPGLSLTDVFRRALAVLGPAAHPVRIGFVVLSARLAAPDSRGPVRRALDEIDLDAEGRAAILRRQLRTRARNRRNPVAADGLTPAGRADKAQAVGGSAPPGAIPSAMQPGRAGRSRSEPVRW